jgi:hypothetical protein
MRDCRVCAAEVLAGGLFTFEALLPGDTEGIIDLAIAIV